MRSLATQFERCEGHVPDELDDQPLYDLFAKFHMQNNILVGGIAAASVAMHEQASGSEQKIKELDKALAGVNKQLEESLAAIGGMKSGAMSVGPVFEGVTNRLRNFASGILFPFKEAGPAIAESFKNIAKFSLSKSTDDFKKSLDGALDRVKKLKGDLDELRGKERESISDADKRLFEVERARAVERGGEGAGRALDLARARDLEQNARTKDGLSRDERLGKVGESIDLLTELAKNQDVMRNRRDSQVVMGELGDAMMTRQQILRGAKRGVVDQLAQARGEVIGLQADQRGQDAQEKLALVLPVVTTGLQAAGQALRQLTDGAGSAARVLKGKIGAAGGINGTGVMGSGNFMGTEAVMEGYVSLLR